MSWALLALVTLAGGALASLVSRRSRPRLAIGLTASAAAGVCCILAGWSVLSGSPAGPMTIDWPLPLGTARLAIDGLSAWFLTVVGVVALPAALYSWGYYGNSRGGERAGLFGPLLCLLIAALILVLCAADVVLFLLGWELMSLSAFLLVGLHDENPEARHGAWMYLVATHLGTALGVLPLFAVLIARSGSTAFSAFGQALHGGTAPGVALFVLGVIGFGTKAGFMPFHVWLPVAHPVAPSPVSALLSGVVIKTGIYGLLRLLSWLPDLPAGCGVGLLILAMITGVLGMLCALGQSQLKRMLAYSSVENIGIIGVAIALGMLGRTLQQPLLVALGLSGALLHVLNHALFKGLLFLSAGAVLHDTGSGHIEGLGGLARRTPINAVAFLTGSIAICALPPLNGFLSEFLIYTGLLRGVVTLPSSWAVVLVLATASLALIGGLALVGFSKVFAVVFLGEPRDASVVPHPTPRTMNAALLLLGLGCCAVSAGAGGLSPALWVALLPCAPESSLTTAAVLTGLAPLGRVCLLSGVLVAAALALSLLRRRLPSAAPAGGAGGTWGCGYARPGPRMQYTGSSYVWELLWSLRHVARCRRLAELPAGCFPPRQSLSTRTEDLALDRAYRPLFTRLARGFERLWPLQHGRIQLYLMYIVVTVLVVFLVEAALAAGPCPANRRGELRSSLRPPSSVLSPSLAEAHP